MRLTIAAITAAATLLAATAASAVTVAWTGWTGATDTVASGTIVSGTTTLGVTLATSGEPLNFIQTGTGPNYFIEPNPASLPYTGGIVDDSPPAAEMVSLSAGGTKTISFSQAVTNPYIAFVSWNGNAASFSQPFEKVSEGCGYWGCGTFDLGTDNTFVGNGEVHGILRFVGTFTTLTFTDSSEDWHGLTIGIDGVADTAPEPASWALLITGFGMIGATMRRRRPVAA